MTEARETIPEAPKPVTTLPRRTCQYAWPIPLSTILVKSSSTFSGITFRWLKHTREYYRRKMCCKPPGESEDCPDYHRVACTARHLSVRPTERRLGKKFKLTIGSVTKYPIVKLVIIHEEFCRASNRDAIVSCVAQTSDVSAYASKMPSTNINHHVQNLSPQKITYQEVLQTATVQTLYSQSSTSGNSLYYPRASAATASSRNRTHHRLPPHSTPATKKLNTT